MAPATFVNTNGNNTDINVSKKNDTLDFGSQLQQMQIKSFSKYFHWHIPKEILYVTTARSSTSP